MNHCLLEVTVQKAPTVRYTQDNKTPIAEMEVLFDGLRADDSPGILKVVGWGSLAQELQERVTTGDKFILEGRLRMNTVPRQDGTKEKRAEFTLSKLHPLSMKNSIAIDMKGSDQTKTKEIRKAEQSSASQTINTSQEGINWNSAPLVPDTDEIPF